MESLPGYDQWRLATPPHYEKEQGECLCDDVARQGKS